MLTRQVFQGQRAIYRKVYLRKGATLQDSEEALSKLYELQKKAREGVRGLKTP